MTRRDNAELQRTVFLRPRQTALRVESLEARRLLAIVTVNTPDDVVDGDVASIADLLAAPGADGKISLREAIEATNNTSGADEIEFDAALSDGVIVLGGTELAITDDLTITGLGADHLTIDGDGKSRVLNVDDGTSNQVSISINRLTISGGRADDGNPSEYQRSERGGGIISREHLSLTGSSISGNTAVIGGGIFNYGGLLTIVESMLTGNSATAGGAVRNSGSLSIADSILSGNIATSTGGAIHNLGGDIGISDSILSRNSAGEIGGAIDNVGELNIAGRVFSGNSSYAGGGIDNFSGRVTIADSTISGNSARNGGGLNCYWGQAVLVNSTVSDNDADELGGGARVSSLCQLSSLNSTITDNSAAEGGGIYHFNPGPYEYGRVALTNSIVSGSSTGSDVVVKGELVLQGVNLVADGSVTGAGVLNVDPLLGPLADNGGPTLTHALLPGSPAINAGDNAAAVDKDGNPLVFDQRGDGFPRIVGGTVDLGAVEAPLGPLVVDTLEDLVDVSTVSIEALLADRGADERISLREAIEATNNTPGADEIEFDEALADGVIVLGGTQLVISDDLTITGLGADHLAIDGDGLSRVLSIDDLDRDLKRTVEISGLTITGGATTEGSSSKNGAGLFTRENLTLANAVVSGNSAAPNTAPHSGGFGGGIFSDGADVLIVRSTISSNIAGSSGGGIANTLGVLQIQDSTVSGNTAQSGGGGIYDVFGSTNIVNSTVSGNSALYGGGIYNFGSMHLTNVTIAGNSADVGGGFSNGEVGGVFSGNAVMENTIVADSPSGGDVEARSGTLTFKGWNLFSDGSLPGTPNVIRADPLLGPLVDNGGPTLTHALLSGSPAIDAGNDALAVDADGAPLVSDQRGTEFPRVRGDAVDLGAFESLGPPVVYIARVTPDPRGEAVSTIEIVFTEPVTGFDLSDLTLDRGYDGKGDLLSFPGFDSAATLTTDDSQAFVLGGLESRTASGGIYVLKLDAEGSGIESLDGKPLAAGAVERWTNNSAADVDPPAVRITPIDPNPAITSVDAIEIVFSEPVAGFDLADLNLDQNYDGLGNRLTGAESLASDDGRTYLLSGLAPLTLAEASYVLSLNAAASGIVDLAGNSLANNGHVRWNHAATPPTADVVDVTPDPRLDAPVDVISIVFSEQVSGFDLSDLVLDRANDGLGNLLTGSEALATSDGAAYMLSGLAAATSAVGDYILTLVAEGSGIEDANGNLLLTNASDAWRNDVTIDVVADGERGET